MLYLLIIASASELDHIYSESDDVTLYYNRGILPNSPNLLFSFSEIPLCQGPKVKDYPSSLSTILSGISPISSGIDLKFRQDSITQEYCRKVLTEDEQNVLINIIKLGLYGEFLVDQLPVWTELGKEDGEVYFYSTFHITAHYNKKNIVQVKVLPDNPVLIYDPDEPKLKRKLELSMAYSVTWIPSEEPFELRMQIYSDSGLFPTSIHWLGLLNSSALILAVCVGIMCLLFKSVKKDLVHNLDHSDIFDMPSGWKNIKMEALSSPVLNPLLSSMSGIGSQIFLLLLSQTILTELNLQNKDLPMIVLISLSGLLGAQVTVYSQQEVKGWVFAVLLAGGCFPLSCILLIIILQLLGVDFEPVYLLACLINPLLFVMMSRRLKPESQKFRIKGSVYKKKPWYLEQYFLIPIGGILPFISIALEFSYLLRSLLAYQFYIMNGFLLISFTQLVLCVACVGVVNTYLTLNTEDSKWQWCSFISGGVIAGYIWMYSVYFYVFVNGVDGIFRFLAAMSGICGAVFLAFGFVSFVASKYFVRRLYHGLKHD